MDDKLLRQLVVNELDFEPSVEAEHIGVAVDDGVLTLTGHVPSYAIKVAAEKAVRDHAHAARPARSGCS